MPELSPLPWDNSLFLGDTIVFFLKILLFLQAPVIGPLGQSQSYSWGHWHVQGYFLGMVGWLVAPALLKVMPVCL